MKGIGVILKELTYDGSSGNVIRKASGVKILNVTFKDDALHFKMVDGNNFLIQDDGLSCCERRYMKCDDNLKDFEGATFLGVEVRDGGITSQEWTEHEVAFLVIKTSVGDITANTHNEHNGYYGGFAIQAHKEEGDNRNE